MVVPKINSSHGSETRNIINAAIDAINVQGKTIQDLVAEGQLTPAQYAQLIKTVNGLIAKGEITIDDVDKNNFKIDQTMITNELLQQIAGTADINAVPADGSLTTRKYVDKSVTPEKTDFFNISDNKFNPDKAIDGKSIDVEGNVVDDSSRWLSSIIDLPSSKVMSITKGNYRIARYDENNGSLSRSGITDASLIDFSSSPNTVKIRLSGIDNKNSIMLNNGPTLKPFVEHEETLKKEHIPVTSFDELSNVSIHPNHEVHFRKSNNIFNKNTLQKDKSIDSSGNEITEEGRWLSDLIPIDPYKIIHVNSESVFRYTLYDINENPGYRFSKVIGDTTIDFRIDGKYHYIKVSPVTAYKDSIMMNQGSGLLPKDDYGYTLVSTPEIPISIAENIIPAGTGGDGGAPSTGIQGSSQIFEQSNQNYISGQSRQIYTTTNTSEVDYIEVSSNSQKADIVLTYINDSGVERVKKIINTETFENSPQSIENVVNYGGVGVEFLQYDEGANAYKIALKQLKFSDGFKLSMRNSGDADISIAVSLAGRYYV